MHDTTATTGPRVALEVERIHKHYGRKPALKGISLAVPEGQFVALLGPNGAGKSTLIQLLTGLFVADEGRIAVAGFDMRRAPVRALAHIGVVFQQPTLDLDLTVRANLALHADLHGLPGRVASQRIDETLARADLTGSADDRVRTLSGGNRRRAELARALVHEPRVLLMDEATAGLDPASRIGLLADVHALCENRRTAVLWTTHLIDEADRADRVVVLNQGEILADAPPPELVASTATDSLANAFLALTAREAA